jgi:peptidyl-prolyl cis-trans isomerase C
MPRRASLLVVFLLAGLGGCSRGGKDAGPAVAKGDGVLVTAGEFKAKMEEQSPFVRARYNTLERKKEFLENLIRLELLAAEARRRGLDKDPEVQATLEKIMVQKLVRTAFDEKGGAEPDADAIRKYYEEHQGEFVKPERVRVSHILLRAEKGSPQRAQKLAAARKLLASLHSDRSPLAFSNAARDVSEDAATKAAGGDLGYRTREELAGLWSPEVAEAAFALKDAGQVSAVVEGAQGLHLLRLTARQQRVDRSLDEVKGQLAARLSRESRTKEFDEFLKKLRESAGIQIDDAALDKVEFASASPGPGAPAAAIGAPVHPVGAALPASAPPGAAGR